MKRLLILLFLSNFIINFKIFSAEAKIEEKQSSNQKVTILKNLLKQLTNNQDAWSKKIIDEQIEKIKRIFDLGINVNVKVGEYNDSTPLLIISQYPKLIKLAQWLIEKKHADVNVKDCGNWTPLKRALFALNLNLAMVLIKHGANVNYVDNFGKSLIFYVVNQANLPPLDKRKKLIKLLLINGAKYNDINFNSMINRADNIRKKEIFEQVKKEIIDSYRKKINDYEQDVRKELKRHLPKDLAIEVTHFTKYTDAELLDNIIEIRKILIDPDLSIEFQQPRPANAKAATY